jgi:hypothetical protein
MDLKRYEFLLNFSISKQLFKCMFNDIFNEFASQWLVGILCFRPILIIHQKLVFLINFMRIGK